MIKKGNKLIFVQDEDIELLQKDPNLFWQDIEVINEKSFGGKKDLKSIQIPESVKEIGNIAFGYCVNLESVKLPENLTKISRSLFTMCENLTEVNMPKSVTEIEMYAFWGCTRLKNIELPKSLTKISDGALGACQLLTDIDIPKSVKLIGKEAFAYDQSLKNVILPPELNEIAENAFLNCTRLESITIPNSCEKIGVASFARNYSLKRAELGKGLKKIGIFAFCDCKHLESITIPEKIIAIESFSFHRCESLKDITFKGEIDKILSNAFSNCFSLNHISLPDSLKTIGKRAFFNCKNLQEINLKNVTIVDDQAFHMCKSLKSVNIPSTVTEIGKMAFADCNLSYVTIPSSVGKIGARAFELNENSHIELNLNKEADIDINAFWVKDLSKQPKYMYYSKSVNKIVITSNIDNKYENDNYIRDSFSQEKLANMFNINYRNNIVKLQTLKQNGKIRFVPPAYLLKAFPYTQIEKFYVNKNHTKWGHVVQKFKLDTLFGEQKRNAILSLFKVYYAMGGFSDKQEESQKAFDYITTYYDKFEKPSEKIGDELIKRFSNFEIFEQPNKVFAKFFMKYYKNNPNFMTFDIEYKEKGHDYLVDSQKDFERLLKDYPNRVLRGNSKRGTLTPYFIALHCGVKAYKNVEKGNEKLAFLIGKYNYTQEQFEHIQKVYNDAKKQKNSYVIVANKRKDRHNINYRVLKKDDIMGFVLGELTNCCQSIGDNGETCVDDGYLNKNSGFLVFEESVVDNQGNLTGEKRILAQAYVWYDPQTSTVCYDNIEVPKSVLSELEKAGKKKLIDLIYAVNKSAENIMIAMNKRGTFVERVTTGEGANDLKKYLSKVYDSEVYPIAKNRAEGVYTDASKKQFIIKTYNKLSEAQIKRIESMSKNIKNNINAIKNELDGSVVKE